MRFRDGLVLIKLTEEKYLIAEFVLPAVDVLNEFLSGREVVPPVKSGDVGGGLKKEVDKTPIGFFDVSGVKISVDIKGTVISEINVKAVEFHAEAFGWIDEVSFFAGSVTRGRLGIICAGVLILVIFGRVLGAIGFGELNLRVGIESKLTALVGNVRRDDTALPVVAKGSERNSGYIDESA